MSCTHVLSLCWLVSSLFCVVCVNTKLVMTLNCWVGSSDSMKVHSSGPGGLLPCTCSQTHLEAPSGRLGAYLMGWIRRRGTLSKLVRSPGLEPRVHPLPCSTHRLCHYVIHSRYEVRDNTKTRDKQKLSNFFMSYIRPLEYSTKGFVHFCLSVTFYFTQKVLIVQSVDKRYLSFCHAVQLCSAHQMSWNQREEKWRL